MKLLFAVIGLASYAFVADAGPVASACGPDEVRFHVKTNLPAQAAATAQPGKALVYAIEDSPYGATVRIGLDGAWVWSQSRRILVLVPGRTRRSSSVRRLAAELHAKHHRTAFSQLFSLTSFHAETGNVYYFRVRISMRG